MGAEHPGRPVCTIIGGPNGSGKSTIYDRPALPGRFLNADAIARGINPDHPEAASFTAGRQTLAELARAIGAQETFVYETTLSSRQSIDLMRTARQTGYEVGLVFVALSSADLNVERVAERVARGGHDIPEDVIRRRYETAVQRLSDAIRLADGSILFDNSTTAGPQLLAQIQTGVIEVNHLDAADAFHGRWRAQSAARCPCRSKRCSARRKGAEADSQRPAVSGEVYVTFIKPLSMAT